MTTVKISDDQSHWMGMDDYEIILTESGHAIELKYLGEPPHGDSYHSLNVDGLQLEGFFWGCNFIFPDQQKYMVCSWMEKLYERKTIVVNLSAKSTYLMSDYWYDYKVNGDVLIFENNNFGTTTRLEIKNIQNLPFNIK
ncbi:hypothetical protein [Pedobacter metabolipauper]|uniref:Uncharacterized protein n=1 Tax=Pedobacter metabolipauper TaxID=425513 RepID=A0A4R6SWP2_9SPHI|nr:hypothetical protein [Pedobacter metabolipauper]TDQ08799.1 hypothetical protein ATK78_3317 [Pedobacter metabolipauper]